MPRLTASDLHWETPVAEPRLTSRSIARALKAADRQTDTQITQVDRCLSAWAGHQPKTAAIDHLLDERLFVRPPDVMDTWPGRNS